MKNKEQKESNRDERPITPKQLASRSEEAPAPEEKTLGPISQKLPEKQAATRQAITSEANAAEQPPLEDAHTRVSKQQKGSGTGGNAMEVDTPNTGTTEEATAMAAATQETMANGQSNSGQNDTTKPWMVSYYEWHMKHHQWLNVQMWQALGKKDAPEPPHFMTLRYPVCLDLDNTLNLEPRWKYTMQYKMRIVMAEATNPVEAYCQVILEWFNNVLKVDSEAVIYPWAAVDRQVGTTVIEDPDELPTSFSSLKKYTPKAWIRLKGGTIYPKILMGLDMEPATIVEDISWWLQSTKQGM